MHYKLYKHASVFLQGFSSGWSRWAVSLSIMSLLFYLIVGIVIRSVSVPSTYCGWIEGVAVLIRLKERWKSQEDA